MRRGELPAAIQEEADKHTDVYKQVFARPTGELGRYVLTVLYKDGTMRRTQGSCDLDVIPQLLEQWREQ